jgi:hypothetical protein
MPHLLGDDPYNDFKTNRWGLTVTISQYAALEQWAKGKFKPSGLSLSSLFTPPIEPLTPDGLDRAALENASGGAFFPGIEVGWQIREPSLFSEPFRLKVPGKHGATSKYVFDPPGSTVDAGYFSRQMALPWVADFLQCKTENQKVTKKEWNWWPSQRPDSVYLNATDAKNMATMLHWHRATVGATDHWPPQPTANPPGRAADMPSYGQMVEHWWKLGTIDASAGLFSEIGDRASSIP